MAWLGIVTLSVLASVAYGILHDQVTARVCVEYFTIGHPPVFATDSPTLLALGWGVIATWWMGLILGVPLATCARAGSRPKLSAPDLVRPVLALLLAMAVLSLLAGIAGYLLARSGAVVLVGRLAEQVPRTRHVPFLADLWAHWAAYGSGALGGIALCVRTWRRRGRIAAGAV